MGVKETSLAILKAAQEGGYLDAIPTEEEEIIEMAEVFAEHADKEFKTNAKMRRDKTIKEILYYKDQLDRNGNNLRNELEERLPEPRPIDRDPAEMPFDITNTSDRDVRKLHGEYNAYLNRARWLLAMTATELSNITHLRDESHRKASVRCYETLTEDGRRVSKDIIDTFAKGDSDYKEYEENVKLLQNKLTRYKALVEIYSGNVDRLSREWTMRQNEWERGK